MSKQDRVAPRTAADLESKYNFGKSFAEVMGFAKDAEKAAEEAKDAAANASNAVGDLDEKLDQTEIFNRLTNNGESQGVYRGEDGQIYINASYIKAGELLADLIKSGVLSSQDGTVQVDLSNNKISVQTLIGGRQGKIELSASGIYGYGFDAATNSYYRTLVINPGGKTGSAEETTAISAWESTAGLSLSGGRGFLEVGDSMHETNIKGSSIKIGGKSVSWRDNGDGTYTLIGT